MPVAARRGARGLLVIVPLSALRVVIDQNGRDFDHSGWVPLFAIALFVAYVVAGVVAGTRRARRAAVERPPRRGRRVRAVDPAPGADLGDPRRGAGPVQRPDPVFTPGRILGQLVFAAAFGAFGGWIASARRVGSVDAERRSRVRTRLHAGGESAHGLGCRTGVARAMIAGRW